ncbi:MAG TPA: hypothetical protein VN369_02570 [Terriglobales bacterium]|nr:hypothetical protein [Terriglobales bacterium]
MKQYKLSIDVKKRLTSGTLLLGAVGYALTAAAILLWPSLAAELFHFAMATLLTVLGLSGIVGAFSSDADRRPLRLLLGCANLGLAAFTLLREETFFALFPPALGSYLLLTAAIHFITFFLRKRDRMRGAAQPLLLGLVSLGFGAALILYPSIRSGMLRFLLAGYFILMSLSTASDFRRELFPGRSPMSDVVKRHIRIQLPTGLTALVPRSAIDKVNETLRLTKDEPEQDLFKDPCAVPDLEIFIHAAKKGAGVFGHVDLCYEDTVMTFGSYDEASYRLGGVISSGVLAIVKGKEKYLDYCIKARKKSIFGFGLRLTEGQRERVELRMEDLMREVDPWPSPIQRDPCGTHDDYASSFVKNLDAQLYKFRSGGFRTYFAASTNCALLADKVVGLVGTDIISLNGILTPGAYYSYLDREFRRKNSIVITKTLYKEQEDEK